MGLFSGLLGGGGGSAPTLRAPGAEEQAGLSQLVTRGEAGTRLATGAVGGLEQLRGPEVQTQLQALGQLMSLLSGGQFTSPTAEEGIRRQRGITEERVRRQLGPGGEVSTPGRESLAQFGTQSEIFREQARTEELGRLLQVLGLLGPQTRQTAQLGFAEPSPGILRQTGVQERLGEFGAQSQLAGAMAGAGSSGLGALLGSGGLPGAAGGLGALLSRLMRVAGPVAGVATGNPMLMLGGGLPGVGAN